jgi:hypothetical protein
MKKLILIQNDYSGAGKTTLTRCLTRYLNQNRAPYQLVVLSEEEGDAEGAHAWLDANSLSLQDIIAKLDSAPITILEATTGQGEFFAKFYESNELQDLLHEMGVEMTVVVPVTSETDSHESVIEAAEVYSDNAQYLIAHQITSSYEDDDKVWDRSYAARVMDMFEAVELHIPEVDFQLEHQLRALHTDVASALLEEKPDEIFGKDFTKWHSRVATQIESAHHYLFSEIFKPLSQPTPKKRGRKAVEA